MGYIGAGAAPQIPEAATNSVATEDIQNNAVTPAKLSTSGPNWDSSGNVGIGTSSPNQNGTGVTCHINSSTAGTWATTHYTNGSTGSAAADGFLVGTLGADGAYVFNYENTPMIFATNSVERMRIDASGNVGVGTSTIAPAGGKNLQIGDRSNLMQLSINNGLYFGNNLYYDGSTWRYNQTAAGSFVGISGGVIVFGTAASGTAGDMATTTADKMILTSSSLTLSGVGSRGTSGYVLTTPNDTVANLNRQAGYIEMLTDSGAVGVTYFVSDERKKENIAPCVKTSSDLIKDINFIQFDWKEDSGNLGHVDVGVSAQQLQSIDSRLVNELSDGSLMVNEPALVTHLAKALQEQQAIISDLKARIEILESK